MLLDAYDDDDGNDDNCSSIKIRRYGLVEAYILKKNLWIVIGLRSTSVVYEDEETKNRSIGVRELMRYGMRERRLIGASIIWERNDSQ